MSNYHIAIKRCDESDYQRHVCDEGYQTLESAKYWLDIFCGNAPSDDLLAIVNRRGKVIDNSYGWREC